MFPFLCSFYLIINGIDRLINCIYTYVINFMTRLDNGINLFVNAMNRLFNGIHRLIDGVDQLSGLGPRADP